jgi:hypothetical protein
MFAVASGAMADLVPVGPFETGGSWGQTFWEGGLAGDFDRVTVEWDETVTSSSFETFEFEPQTFRGLPDGWLMTVDNGTEATATGPAQSAMNWSIWFTEDSSTPLAFNYWAFSSGGEILDWAYVSWDGTDWSIDTLCPVPEGGDIQLVPVPVAVLLGLLGLGAAGLKLRRFV